MISGVQPTTSQPRRNVMANIDPPFLAVLVSFETGDALSGS
jgi:hypothetical protein